MKKIAVVLALLSSAFCLTIAQRKPVKQVQLTAETIASQPADKPYIIDLTRSGTVYTIAADLDYSRVKVRRSKGLVGINEMWKQLGKRGAFTIATAEDMRIEDLDMTPSSGSTKPTCGVLTCECTGPANCVNLDRSGRCKGAWQCDKKGCACFKLP